MAMIITIIILFIHQYFCRQLSQRKLNTELTFLSCLGFLFLEVLCSKQFALVDFLQSVCVLDS